MLRRNRQANASAMQAKRTGCPQPPASHPPASQPPASQPPASQPPASIAIALGGGGARGLAHIAVIEAFDEIGIKPAVIAGTSMGAIIGAAWAAGMSGRDIRAYVLALTRDRPKLMRGLMKARAGRFVDVLGGKFTNPVMVDGERLRVVASMR